MVYDPVRFHSSDAEAVKISEDLKKPYILKKSKKPYFPTHEMEEGPDGFPEGVDRAEQYLFTFIE